MWTLPSPQTGLLINLPRGSLEQTVTDEFAEQQCGEKSAREGARLVRTVPLGMAHVYVASVRA